MRMEHNPSSLAALSRVGARLCTAIAFTLPPLAVAYWLVADPATLVGNYRESLQGSEFTYSQRLAGLGVTLVSLSLVCTVIWRLRRLFFHFTSGTVLSETSARLVRSLAVGIALYALVIIPAQAAFSFILTMNAPPGRTVVQLAISSETLILFVLAGLLGVLAAVLDHASLVQHDNSLIV